MDRWVALLWGIADPSLQTAVNAFHAFTDQLRRDSNRWRSLPTTLEAELHRKALLISPNPTVLKARRG
eukprot:1204479-Rhodomonas_salina.2